MKFITVGAALLLGCAGPALAQTSTAPVQARSAVATLQAAQGSNAAGTITFTRRGNAIDVNVNVRGLRPGGHGFHIHERGDCSAPDFTSAGGHFNPTAMPHGNPRQPSHHAGDLPMLTAPRSGTVRLTTRLSGVRLDQSDTGIVGRAVVIHADPDDYTTQPTGNSGGRIACGVITAR